jgi:type II secretory pathway pseudopilin PulG
MQDRIPSEMNAKGSQIARRGNSLVELSIVFLIMSVIAAAAMPKFADSLQLSRVSSAAKRIIADLATAQARARMISASQSVVFTVSSSNSQYQLVGMPSPDRVSVSYAIALSQDPYYASLLSAELGGDTTIVFNGYGIPDSAGIIVVQVGSLTKTISIDASTGEATLQ